MGVVMQTKSLSQIFIHVRSWLGLMALAACFVGMSGLAALASPTANGLPILAIDITQVPTDYTGDGLPLNLGHPSAFRAWGSDSSGLGWDFEFQTADPTYSRTTCAGYFGGECIEGYTFDRYGQGGSFTLTGPNGEQYSGVILDGWLNYYWLSGVGFDGDYQIRAYGSWNDGSPSEFVRGMGGINDDQEEPATLHFFTPEPTSLVLLGSGIVGLAGLLRRKLSL